MLGILIVNNTHKIKSNLINYATTYLVRHGILSTASTDFMPCHFYQDVSYLFSFFFSF